MTIYTHTTLTQYRSITPFVVSKQQTNPHTNDIQFAVDSVIPRRNRFVDGNNNISRINRVPRSSHISTRDLDVQPVVLLKSTSNTANISHKNTNACAVLRKCCVIGARSTFLSHKFTAYDEQTHNRFRTGSVRHHNNVHICFGIWEWRENEYYRYRILITLVLCEGIPTVILFSVSIVITITFRIFYCI